MITIIIKRTIQHDEIIKNLPIDKPIFLPKGSTIINFHREIWLNNEWTYESNWTQLVNIKNEINVNTTINVTDLTIKPKIQKIEKLKLF